MTKGSNVIPADLKGSSHQVSLEGCDFVDHSNAFLLMPEEVSSQVCSLERECQVFWPFLSLEESLLLLTKQPYTLRSSGANPIWVKCFHSWKHHSSFFQGEKELGMNGNYEGWMEANDFRAVNGTKNWCLTSTFPFSLLSPGIAALRHPLRN